MSIKLIIIPEQNAHEILKALDFVGLSVFSIYPITNGNIEIPQGLKITLAIPQRNAPENFNAPDENITLKILSSIDSLLFQMQALLTERNIYGQILDYFERC